MRHNLFALVNGNRSGFTTGKRNHFILFNDALDTSENIDKSLTASIYDT
ncbi:hypothetical protein SDC9_152520 [bioreactor metagenome]|uniref:Uncharacterized protein n=1 Tax=bioreactor metagenome TaxID=1076179 RepID=A0A645EUY7_9ZZZZ